jgi:hypothetical protein
MGLRTALFVGAMLLCSVGLFVSPVWPLCGYILHYSTGPEAQWWASPVNALGIRYSLSLAILGAVAIGLHADRLQRAKPLITRTEWLMLGLLALVWAVSAIAPQTVGRYTTVDHPTVKLSKVLIFSMMLTHAAITKRDLNIVLWAMMIGGLILGLEAYEKPYGAFIHGRLEGVGGPDFSDSNRLAGYLAGLLPIIGTSFLLSGWPGRFVLFLTGGFVANTISLTRCRGAVLGLALASIVAVVAVPRAYRGKILLALVLGVVGMLFLADDIFLRRSSTITADQEERDSSAQARIDLAIIGVKMVRDHPLGVGPGNWYQFVGRYDSNYEGRDAHSTFTRCLGELGIVGLLLLVGILLSSAKSLFQVFHAAKELPDAERKYYQWTSIGMAMGIVATFGYGLTGTLLYTEYAWWMLALPICLQRALANTRADLTTQQADEQYDLDLSEPTGEAEQHEPVHAGHFNESPL